MSQLQFVHYNWRKLWCISTTIGGFSFQLKVVRYTTFINSKSDKTYSLHKHNKDGDHDPNVHTIPWTKEIYKNHRRLRIVPSRGQTTQDQSL